MKASRLDPVQALGDEEIHSISMTVICCSFCDASPRPSRAAVGSFGKPNSCRNRRDGTVVACRVAVTADVKRQIGRMVGEFLREAGVLVIVLAPLEWLVSHGTLTLNAIAAIVVVAVPCLIAGMALGLER
jgi:hypothetical protein